MIPVQLPDRLLVRRAGPADAAAVQALVERSDLASRYSRFHGALRRLPAPYLHLLVDAPASVHDTLLVEADGVVVGYGDLGPVTGEPGVVEIGLLVEEPWRGRGVATVLLDELADRATARGATVLRAVVLHDTLPGVRSLLRGREVVTSQATEHGVVVDLALTA